MRRDIKELYNKIAVRKEHAEFLLEHTDMNDTYLATHYRGVIYGYEDALRLLKASRDWRVEVMKAEAMKKAEREEREKREK